MGQLWKSLSHAIFKIFNILLFYLVDRMVAVQFDQDIKFYQGFHNPWYLGSRCGKGLKRLLTWKKASFLRPLGIYTIRACGILLNILFIFRAPFKLYCYIQFSEILEGLLWGVRESGGSHLNNWKVVSRTRISRKWLEIGNLAPHGSTHSPRKRFLDCLLILLQYFEAILHPIFHDRGCFFGK